jgi:hypothetical protein
LRTASASGRPSSPLSLPGSGPRHRSGSAARVVSG